MRLPAGSKVSGCRACGLVFTTPGTFARHRVGGYDIAAPQYGRRCLTAEEMAAKGWSRDRFGRWRGKARLATFRDVARLLRPSRLDSTIG